MAYNLDYSQQTLPEVMTQSADFIWNGMISFIPRLFLAVVLFIAFWIIGATLAQLASKIVAALKIDIFLVRIGAEKPFQRAGLNLNAGNFIGALVKWFTIITGLLVASNLVGLNQVSDFLTQILYYIPNIAVAAVILIAGALLADFVSRAAASSIAASGLKSGPFVSNVVKWAVLIFAFITALDQLGIAQTFVNTLYIGLVGMLALAGGLAFGLGGKEHASAFISKIKMDITER